MSANESRRRRRDGEQSRSAILGEAARLATVEGLGGLSLARLADTVGMSKSGVFELFGSKEGLQLATVDSATSVFEEHVLEPAANANGLARVHALVEAFFRYVETDVFPGGCFFASALTELSMQPGPVRDRLVAFLERWLGELAAAVREAQAEGAIDPAEDPDQLAFEIEAALFFANAGFVVARTPEAIERARRTIERRLGAATAA
ncbi:MAG TPA: TetR family transcriptional regulator C-terminal domain-containing protein [Gaiellaceae bacterium]|nr:TetR family transcriptional regulator C-terminal domain-containing protein [Gaiellaceae bacterium]